MDVYEAKEALHQVRSTHPDDHATRDFFERKLLEIVERQKQTKSQSKAKPKEVDEKKKTN